MKKILTIICFLLATTVFTSKAVELADPMMIELTRTLSRDLFQYNGVEYAQPIVIVANASTNARFYNDAFVPRKVERAYFRFSLNGMQGYVGENLKSFTPVYPMEEYTSSGVAEFVSFGYTGGELQLNIKDTVGLYDYILLNLLYDGITNGIIDAPGSLPTALGSKEVNHLDLPLDTLLKRHELYGLLPEDQREAMVELLGQFPASFPMPSGSDISNLMVGVPQIEIGSFMGTELLLRLIPPMDLGKTFGDFSFWGIGLKHSLSQYFNQSDDERLFDLALQVVYQRTHLKNIIGATNAELIADANIFNINLHASKQINDWFTIYTGISYEQIGIDMDYTYYIPVEIQRQLGLIEEGYEDPTPGYPGDQSPQKTQMDFSENQVKWKIGAKADIGNFDIALDYSVSEFNMFSLGVRYTLYKPDFVK